MIILFVASVGQFPWGHW